VAPFLTHLVIGEQVWRALDLATPPTDGRRGPGADDYGTFLFGCLAPDVDKFCAGLDQATTHFLPKDEGYAYAWRRSKHFLDHQAELLRARFHALSVEERAFVLGYLCHVATDEISARWAETQEADMRASGARLPDVDAMLTAIDPRFWTLAADPKGIIGALSMAAIPRATLPFVPAACLRAMHQIILPQVREGGGLEPYLRMVRRHRHWLRRGRVSDATDDARLEAELANLRQRLQADLPASERLVDGNDFDRFLDEAMAHSLQRIRALQALEGRG
jgi:hypothetical protein